MLADESMFLNGRWWSWILRQLQNHHIPSSAMPCSLFLDSLPELWPCAACSLGIQSLFRPSESLLSLVHARATPISQISQSKPPLFIALNQAFTCCIVLLQLHHLILLQGRICLYKLLPRICLYKLLRRLLTPQNNIPELIVCLWEVQLLLPRFSLPEGYLFQTCLAMWSQIWGGVYTLGICNLLGSTMLS